MIVLLIAHSDPVVAAGLAVLLQRGREFKVVCSGRKGRSAQPSGCACAADVVLTDYDSGITLTASAQDSKSRVIILTHRNRQANICHALANGVRGYLLLGCSLQDLRAGIRSVYEGGVAVTPGVASRIAESMNQETLTTREQSVLRLMTLGRSNKLVAAELGIAVATVKTHVKSIFSKLGASNRGEAVAIAQRRGILPDEPEWQEPCTARSLRRLDNRTKDSAPRIGAPA